MLVRTDRQFKLSKEIPDFQINKKKVKIMENIQNRKKKEKVQILLQNKNRN